MRLTKLLAAIVLLVLQIMTLTECGIVRDTKGELESDVERPLEERDDFEEIKEDAGVEKRNALNQPTRLWLSRDIPYETVGLDSSTEGDLQDAIKDIETKTCIRFHRRTADEDNYMEFHEATGGSCWAPIGNNNHYAPMAHKITIGGSCGGGMRMALHEIMHTLGFVHEFIRPDRDDYLIINWDNIYDKKLYEKIPKDEAWAYQTFGTPYDYDSVMNYHASNRIRVRNDPNWSLTRKLGRARELSKLDAFKINKLYQCAEESTDTPHYTEWGEWGECFTKGFYKKDGNFPVWQNKCQRRRKRYCFSKNLDDCKLSTAADEDEEAKRLMTEVDACAQEDCDWGDEQVPDGSCDFESFDGNNCNGYKFATEANWNTMFKNIWKWKFKLDALWKVDQTGRYRSGTGPDSDHTTTKGHYAVLQSSQGSLGWYLGFFTTKFRETRCMTFWYHMDVKKGAKLKVDIITDDWKVQKPPLKIKGKDIKGNKKEWRKKSWTVSAKDGGAFRVAFLAYRAGWQSAVAVDDISFTKGACATKRDEKHEAKILADDDGDMDHMPLELSL